MDILTLLNDKATKAKEKTEMLSNGLLENKIGLAELITIAEKMKDPAMQIFYPQSKKFVIEKKEIASRKSI